MAYNAVPPPLHPDLIETELTHNEKQETGDSSTSLKPAHVSEEHWKRFQQLKSRREAQSVKSTNRRKEAVRRSALKAVRREVTVRDVEEVLRGEGVNVTLTAPTNKSRSKSVAQTSPSSAAQTPPSSVAQTPPSTADWQTVKKYLDPNPQLKGIEKGRYVPKSGLEEQLDRVVQKGQFQAASELSDQLTERQLACKIATAFDCHRFAQKQKADEERRIKKKPNLKWRYEHKKRWETKGNM